MSRDGVKSPHHTMTTQTKTKLSNGTGTHWPPLAHLADKLKGTVTEGDYALCGAKLMGINLPDAAKVCQKCIKIAQERSL